MNNTDFKVIVCAAIRNNKKEVLIARRKVGKILGGFWEFPGGKLEHDEELESALKRELKEELGIEIKIEKLLLAKPFKYEHGAVLILFYLASFVRGAVDPVDHDEIRWLQPSELSQFKLLPANQDAIAILLDQLAK